MNTTYDALGRAAASIQTTSNLSYPFSYQYNLAGGLKSVDYPSTTLNPTQPLKVSYAFNQAGRITSVRKGDAQSTDTYLTTATYWPGGAPSALQMGNGVLEETVINSQQQVASISAKHSGTTLWRSDLTYNAMANNGNIASQSISGSHAGTPLSFSQTYEYDALNRLRSVLDSGAGAPVDAKTQVFVYDRYGNRALKDNSVNPGGGVVATADTAAAVEAVFPNNKLNNCCNAAGDTTSLNGATITYDGEHRVSLVEYTTAPPNPTAIKLRYFYDGDGRRVRSERESGGTVVSSTNFVYDAFGQLMAEYATPAPTGLGRQYLTQDHLGSTRLVTKATGTTADIVYSRHDYLPFGEEIARGTAAYGPSPLSLKFTGKERDAESGLDYFGARYYSGAQGRWTSPDRLNVTEDRLLNPSNTLNKYVYGANNPLRFVDPDGRDVVALVQPPHGFMPGHFALFSHNPNTGAAAFMSFGPTDTSGGGRALTVLGAPMGSTATYGMPKSADELRQSYAALSIQTTPEQAQEVIDFINRFTTTENPYRLFQTNCSTVCRDALKAIGVLPRDFGSITPFGLWTSLYRRYSNPSMQRFTTTTRYGEQFQGLRIDSNKGTDYGSPRFGMNVFDFMMLMLRQQQQPKACVGVSDSATGTQSKQCE